MSGSAPGPSAAGYGMEVINDHPGGDQGARYSDDSSNPPQVSLFFIGEIIITLNFSSFFFAARIEIKFYCDEYNL